MTARRALLASAAVAVGLLLGLAYGVAHGQQPLQPGCDKAEAIRAQLRKLYGEHPLAIGLTAEGKMLEIFSTADGDTWTITETSPAGISCIKAAGRRWEMSPMGDPT
jgi:hypothetical protein